MVCSEHLNNREIIPHISKTQKQKICDNCFSGKTGVVPKVAENSTTPISPSKADNSGNKISTAPSLQVNESTKKDTVETKVNPLQTANPVAQKYLGNVNPNNSTDNFSRPPLTKTSSTSTPVDSFTRPPLTKTPSVSGNNGNTSPNDSSSANATSVIKPHRRSSGTSITAFPNCLIIFFL